MTDEQSRNQIQYWNLFYDLNLYFHYLQIYQERDQIKIRNINIFLAVTSSSSIAAWAIWQKVAWLWAAIIAASQVLNVIASFLPFKQREKSLRDVLPRMHALLLECEDKYDAVSKGELTDKEIHQQTMSFKRKLSALNNDLYTCGLPKRTSFMQQAEKDAKQELMKYNSDIGGA